MTSRELVIRTLNHQSTPRVPRDLWIAPDMRASHVNELAEMQMRFPSDIVEPEIAVATGKRSKGEAHTKGISTDAWGCVWEMSEGDLAPRLKESPLTEKGKIAEYQLPKEILDAKRYAKVNESCASTNRFVLARHETSLFDRLRALRGPEAAVMDLARGTKEIRRLIEMLHDFATKEMEHWAASEVDGVVFSDHWVIGDSMAISPEMWREIFKPLYRQYCQILHAKDKFVFFHSPGNILDIAGDLIKEGVDALFMQFSAMNVEKLARRYRGKVTFWGELDPKVLQGSEGLLELREKVLKIRRLLDYGSGGVIAQCRWEPDVPIQAIVAMYESWLVSLPMHA